MRVALTRQASENAKLQKAVEKALHTAGVPRQSLAAVEVPLTVHGKGEDFESLKERLASIAGGKRCRPPGCIVVTSPEAARALLEAWSSCGASGSLPVPVASVGMGTSAVLRAGGVPVAFEPTVANAEHLSAELPVHLGPLVLYPASAIAPGTLQEGLLNRGFDVERLDVYTTQSVESITAEMAGFMAASDVATFGSPSAVKAWAQHTAARPIAACIGDTSRKTAEAYAFRRILAPKEPGVDSWADVVVQAMREVLEARYRHH